MRRFLFTIVASILMSSGIMAQNVAKECVLVEAFTGIGCPYCPAAANGIAQMLEEGLSIAPLAFHNTYYSPPQYANSETNARATYYNVGSFPTVVIDGMNKIEGGGTASSSMYNEYKVYYDQRINEPSPFTIDLSFDYHSGTQCQVKVVVNKVGDCDGQDLRVFAVLSESNIQQSWQGLQELNAVVRDIITPSTGVALTSDSQVVTALFSVAGYKKENLEIVAWVQNYSGNKEVYQAVKMSVAEEASQYDLGITNVEQVPLESCSGKITPRMSFKNYGNQTINSVLFRITDGDENEIGAFQWEGNLVKGEQTEFIFDEIVFGETGMVKIQAMNLNGNNNDEYDFDNTYSFEAVAPYNLVDGYMKIQLKTGPENFSIEIKNMQSGDVIETFTFEEANKVYQEEIDLADYGCYRVTLKNSKGNGIGDNAFWGIKDDNGETVVMGNSTINSFRYEFPIELTFSGEGLDYNADVNNVEIYPNPASSAINVSAEDLSEIRVYNSVGQLIYVSDTDCNDVKINTESWSNGLYYVNIETSRGVVTSQKIIVNK